MWHYIFKVAVTAVVVVAVSELGKRNTFWAATLVSLPITSLLAFVWIYVETGDTHGIGELSHSILWLMIPSLALFLLLPSLLRVGMGFWPSLATSCAGTAVAYALMIRALPMMGVKL
jgi:uncharacterized membrane protein (GlpM family)